MIIGFDAFLDINNLVYDETIQHFGDEKLGIPTYYKMEMRDGLVNHIHISEDITVPFTAMTTGDWAYATVLNAKFTNSLEAGSVEAGDVEIESIRFQRRKDSDYEWENLAEIPYEPDERVVYATVDRYISNDEIYRYSIIPITATIRGNRMVSDKVTAKFDGVFISDKDNNYRLMYDIQVSDIENNIANAVFEPLSAKYPIVVQSGLDYETFDVTATFISVETAQHGGRDLNIRAERLGKDNLLKFMKNGKPKVYRDYNGRLKLVTVVGKPKESPTNPMNGIATLSFSLIEIGDMDSRTLEVNGLLEKLSEVY